MTGTMHRGPAAPRDVDAEVRPRRRPLLGWAIVLVGMLVAGLVLLRPDAGGTTVSSDDGAIEVDGGLLRVDRIGVEEATHLPMAMPGMTHEPIGEGNFLLRLDVTLGAVDETIDYAPEEFMVSGADFDPVEPYRAVAGPGRIFPGMSAPLLLVYEVPTDAAPFVLEYAGTAVTLEGFVPPEADDHDH
jgi:hypothetical protein